MVGEPPPLGRAPRKPYFAMPGTYLDNNAVAYLAATWSAKESARLLTAKREQIMLGTHVIYESARALLNKRLREPVQHRFTVLAELAERQLVDFLPDGRALRRAEYEEAVTGVPVLKALSRLNYVATMEAIRKLARGDSAAADAFIAGREAHHQGERPATTRRIVIASRRGPDPLPRLARRTSWDAYLTTAREAQGVGKLRAQATQDGVRLATGTAQRILRNPAAYPVLSTWLNCELRLTWQAARTRKAPASSRMDDYRHLIESAGCTRLVTADPGLRCLAPVLSPFRPCIGWEDWRAQLEA